MAVCRLHGWRMQTGQAAAWQPQQTAPPRVHINHAAASSTSPQRLDQDLAAAADEAKQLAQQLVMVQDKERAETERQERLK